MTYLVGQIYGIIFYLLVSRQGKYFMDILKIIVSILAEKKLKMKSIELLVHGKQKIIPKLLNILSLMGFLSSICLLILEKNNIIIYYLIEKLLISLLLFGLISLIIGAYILLNWETNELHEITGKIILTENSIEVDDIFINLENIEKMYLKANSTRRYNRGSDGSGNKIEIKTPNEIVNQYFIIENKEKREDLRNYIIFLKAKNIKILVDGIDLK